MVQDRLSSLVKAVLLLAGLGLAAGCTTAESPGGDDEDRLAEESVATATEAIVGPTCITLQRLYAASTQVQDGPIATDPTNPGKVNTNYGATQQITTGFVNTSYYRAVMQFDLSGVPPGSIVVSGTLTLRLIQSPGKSPLELHAITTPWTEATVTYGVIGSAFTPTVEVTIPTLGVPNATPMTADLTALVGRWVSGALPNNGILFDHPGSGRTSFASSEGPLATRPRLAICYSPSTCANGVQDGAETGVDCGGSCLPCAHPPATELVSGGGTANSPNYKAVYTLGQPTQNQETLTSPSYRAQGGVVGANGSLP